jgi:hypothetical protein
MDSEFFANLGWREGLIALVAVLAGYFVVIFLRYRKLHREKDESALSFPLGARSAVAAYTAEQEPAAAEIPVLEEAAAESEEAAMPEASAVSFPWNEPPIDPPVEKAVEPPAESLDRQALAMLESDVEQLRKEIGSLRAEVLSLREERQRETVKSQVTDKVSPMYSDAMELAMQGQDAAAISLHCGISRAEAELVVALVRNRDS